METLTLEHICPYLPYGLKYKQSLTGAVLTLKPRNIEYFIQTGDKPILRPLEDIGDVLTDMPSCIDNWYSGKSKDRIIDLPYCCVLILLKHHFDIHDLIKRDLAVSIHDIK